MTARAFLGIDCGTQSTKAILLDAETGAVLAIGRAPHELIERDDGTREQEPDWWVEAAVTAVHEARDEVVGGAAAVGGAGGGPNGGLEIAGIGVSGQQHGLVVLGDDDRPLRPAKLWNDTTTAAECRVLTERLGGREQVLELTGNLFLTGYTAPKVAWLRRCEPETYTTARRFCLPHDYLDLWLTGSYATEPGDASGTAYFDARRRRYSEPVLAALDAERDWVATLPPVIESRSVLGKLRPAAAEALGLAAGIPVSAGGGDNMCAAIGVGAVEEGPVVVSLGTSGTAFTYRGSPAFDPEGEAAAFCDSTGGWLPLVCTLNCTGATEWVLRFLGLDHVGLERSLALSPPGARGVSFLPYLAGERTPDLPAGAGAFAGLRMLHGADDLVRAVVEGVTFGLAYGLAALRRTGVEPTEVTLVGGGAASDAWARLVADTLGLPVRRPTAARLDGRPAPGIEAAAEGAALQGRWVIDGLAPRERSAARGDDARWDPRPAPALLEAAERAATLRGLALQGVL